MLACHGNLTTKSIARVFGLNYQSVYTFFYKRGLETTKREFTNEN